MEEEVIIVRHGGIIEQMSGVAPFGIFFNKGEGIKISISRIYFPK